MRSYKELQEQIAALQQQADAQRKAEVSTVIANIRAKMDEYGLTVADIGGRRGPSAAKGAKVAPKYRHPHTGQTWSGRGKQPRWLADAIAAGQSMEIFAL